MDLKRLASKARKVVDDRGGVDSLKADAEELKGIAKGKGSMTDKAKSAAAAIKDPGTRKGGPGEKGPGPGKRPPGARAGKRPSGTP